MCERLWWSSSAVVARLILECRWDGLVVTILVLLGSTCNLFVWNLRLLEPLKAVCRSEGAHTP